MRRTNAQPQYFDQQELLVHPGTGYEPARIARVLGCYASILLPVLTWAGLGAIFLWQGWEFVLWPFLGAPLALWAALLGLPLFIKFRAGSLKAIDSMVMAFEAYMSRAGLAIDLNKDGRVGLYNPEINPVQIEEYRPILFTGRAMSESYHGMPALPEPTMTLADQARQPIKHRVWILPNRERCTVEQVEMFVTEMFTRGWGREAWLGTGPGKLPRPVYDGLLQQLQDARIIVDRSQGTLGKLTVDSPQQALAILNLERGQPMAEPE